MKCKVCLLALVCIALSHARMIYVLSTSFRMSRVCIHLGVHDHPITNGMGCKSLDMAYKHVAQDVIKTSTTKYFAIVMAMSKGVLVDYLLNFHQMVKALTWEVYHWMVMEKFNTLASPNCRNLVSCSKHFLW